MKVIRTSVKATWRTAATNNKKTSFWEFVFNRQNCVRIDSKQADERQNETFEQCMQLYASTGVFFRFTEVYTRSSTLEVHGRRRQSWCDFRHFFGATCAQCSSLCLATDFHVRLLSGTVSQTNENEALTPCLSVKNGFMFILLLLRRKQRV